VRRLLFAALSAALAAAALLVGSHRTRSMPPRNPSATTVALRPPAPGPPPIGARPEIRRFIAAFLSYEVGAGGPAVEKAIRGHASRRFAGQLLSEPPTQARRPTHGTARITSLHIDPVPGQRNLALASGEARRPEGPEPFSFLFARRGGRWLALAPGE
jgi:hypothetical protein